MVNLLLIFQVMVAVALIVIVLAQRSDSDGTGLGGSGGGMGLLSSRAKGNAMTRATAILAAVFMLNSLALDLLTAHRGSITDRIQAGKILSNEPTATTTPLPASKTPDGKPGISVHSPIGAPTTTAEPTQAEKRNAGGMIVPSESAAPEPSAPGPAAPSSTATPIPNKPDQAPIPLAAPVAR